ncbi:hypothetical protein EZ428_23810 [Pedobacter frigiditerrae]|uniref:Uncharacterized protein n=1 Tax=Pedobacter frigiditerrae TaxID=2530452 RepID=A0A4R0MJY2_9SPHI|nr:hypothetical protein [Pedobacter frigiditerrae]TCC86492.1 hypothetical protein EZ428_23810 [Pedobacter frigiditerrae]
MFIPLFIAILLGLVNPSSYPANCNTQTTIVNTTSGDTGDPEPDPEPGDGDGPGTGTGTGGGAGQNPPPPPPKPE